MSAGVVGHGVVGHKLQLVPVYHKSANASWRRPEAKSVYRICKQLNSNAAHVAGSVSDVDCPFANKFDLENARHDLKQSRAETANMKRRLEEQCDRVQSFIQLLTDKTHEYNQLKCAYDALDQKRQALERQVASLRGDLAIANATATGKLGLDTDEPLRNASPPAFYDSAAAAANAVRAELPPPLAVSVPVTPAATAASAYLSPRVPW